MCLFPAKACFKVFRGTTVVGRDDAFSLPRRKEGREKEMYVRMCSCCMYVFLFPKLEVVGR